MSKFFDELLLPFFHFLSAAAKMTIVFGEDFGTVAALVLGIVVVVFAVYWVVNQFFD